MQFSDRPIDRAPERGLPVTYLNLIIPFSLSKRRVDPDKSGLQGGSSKFYCNLNACNGSHGRFFEIFTLLEEKGFGVVQRYYDNSI
jgi:hypothetical protein